MNVTKKDIDALNAEIVINVGPADYENRVSEAIKKVQRTASMPGFRPGKVPGGLIKKQYGTSILVEELNKLLNDTLHNYITENKIEILGNPMPKEEQPVDWQNQKEFTFTYELGLAPEVDVKLDASQAFTYKTVKVDDALVEKYLKDVRRNYGKPVNPETAGDKDVLFVDIVEVDADNNIVPGGVFKSTSIGIDRLKNEAVKPKLIGLKKEDKLIVSVNELYETALDKSVSLGIDKDAAENFNANVQLTVKNIARLDDAELNQELFDKIYGPGKINSEEEFRAKIKEELSMMFYQDSDRDFMKEIEKTLVSKSNLKLPDEFLKRWLMAVNEKPLTAEQLEKEYPDYSNSMKWRLIENKIIKDNDLKVTPEEAAEEAKGFVRAEYARYGQTPQEEEVAKIAQSLLTKEKEAQRIFENLYSKKVLNLIKTSCKLENKEVSYNEFFGISN
ncbi:MAG: trigger factor [Bacteroidia bacterium]